MLKKFWRNVRRFLSILFALAIFTTACANGGESKDDTTVNATTTTPSSTKTSDSFETNTSLVTENSRTQSRTSPDPELVDELEESLQAFCEIDFLGGEEIPSEIACTDGISLSVEGTDRAGWDSKLSAYDLSSDWVVDAVVKFWKRDANNEWRQVADPNYDRFRGPGNPDYSVFEDNLEQRNPFNNRVQVLYVYVTGPGSLTLCSEMAKEGEECAGSTLTFQPWRG